MNSSAHNSSTSEPTLGAHLVTPRRGYTHHGIYVGQGRVIHYAGFSGSLRSGPVEEITLAEFAGDHGWSVRFQGNARFSRREIVRRARSRIGENDYQLVTNNCEHFCAWCRVGLARSEQVDLWRERLGVERSVQALRRLSEMTAEFLPILVRTR